MEPPAPGGEQPQAPSTPEVQPAAPAPKKDVTPTPPPNEVRQDGEDILSAVDLTKMSDAELADLESGDPAKVAAVLKLPPAAKPDAQSAPTPQTNDDGPDRLSLKAVKSKDSRVKIAEAIAAVRDGSFETIEEALIAKLGLKPAATPQDPAAPAAKSETPAAPVVHPKVQSLQDQIAAKETERQAKKAEYDYDEADALLSEIMELKIDLREAQREAESEATSVKGFEAEETESRTRALSKYGEYMTDPTSEFSDLLDVEILLAEKKNDPILTKSDWPEKIADRTYEKHKARFGDGNAAPDEPEAAQTIPPVPKREIRLPGSPVGGGANSTALTPQAAFAELDNLSPEQQAALLEKLEARTSAR